MQALQDVKGRLTLIRTDAPVLKPGTVRIDVHATAVNRADLYQRAGSYSPPPGASAILGLECAGIISEVADDVTAWSIGEPVCALLSGGGYAEQVVVPAEQVLPVPDGYSMEEAAALPEVVMTAYQALYWLGDMAESDHILLHAGASGVGTMATQLATHAGATVYATASAPKHARCRDMGASLTIDYKTESFADRVLDVTDGRGVDVIVDVVGAPYLEDNVRSLAMDGRIVLLALMGGGTVNDWHLAPLFRKRGTLVASTLRNRSRSYKARLVAEVRKTVWPFLSTRALRPVIDRKMPWAEAEKAHELVEQNETAGKVVLTVKT